MKILKNNWREISKLISKTKGKTVCANNPKGLSKVGLDAWAIERFRKEQEEKKDAKA